MIGKLVSHYEIIEKLGEGGMGVVYRARDTKLNRTVALKFLPAVLTRDPEAKERFIREAQAAAALEHPNICNIHEINETEDGQLFIVMACYEGRTLRDMLDNTPLGPPSRGDKGGVASLSVSKAIDIAIQIAQGIARVHEKGIVHRDIKPGNIMFTSRDQVKILDFGLARLGTHTKITKRDTTLGTAAYMSPEQFKNQEIDQRSDIWSLGVVLFEMLTGQLPYEGDYDAALMYAVMNEEPKSVSSMRKDIPQNLERIISRSLEKSPAMRYQNMQEVLDDLKRVIVIVSYPKEQKKSIVVLPFKNMSADAEQEYFCEGITEELINALTQIKDLLVVARTSAFSFKGRDLDIREIGRKLNVDTALEGSVRKSGQRLRITAQLINVEDGYHIWSDKFDRDMEDIFAIQEEISLAIVHNLKINLLKEEKEQIVKRYTDNLEAYHLLLKARYFWAKRTKEGLKKGMQYVHQVLEIDPSYALAHAYLAAIFISLGWLGFTRPNEVFPKAKAAAHKALEIDSSLPQVYAVLALISLFYDWNWPAAEKGFKKALSLNPGYDFAHFGYAVFLGFMGRLEEATPALKKAVDLDPLSLWMNAELGFCLRLARRYDEAQEQLKKTIEMDPNFGLAHYYLGILYTNKGMYREAIPEFEMAIELTGGFSWAFGYLGYTYAMVGQKDEAEKILHALEERSKEEYIRSTTLVLMYYVLGDIDKSFECLEKAMEEHDPLLPLIKVSPEFDIVRLEPRFKAFLKKMKLE